LKTNLPLINTSILFGPYIRQEVQHKFQATSGSGTYQIRYDCKLHAAIKKWLPEGRDVGGLTPIFKISVVSDGNPTPHKEQIFYREDFAQLGAWTEIIFDYDYPVVENTYEQSELFHMNPENVNNEKLFGVEFVLTILEPGYQYFIDKFEYNTSRSRELLFPQAGFNISEQLGEFDNDPAIVSWFGIDEPGSIDNYLPMNEVQNIIEGWAANNYNVRQFTAMDVGNNIYEYGNSKIIDYSNLVQPVHYNINCYWINYPNRSSSTASLIANYNHAMSVYDEVRKYDDEFGASIQMHNFFNLDLPSPDQIVNNVNLALLFGSKELTFWCLQTTSSTDGILDIYGNPKSDGRFYKLKDYIIPRLKGEFGKVLKRCEVLDIFPYGTSPDIDYVSTIYSNASVALDLSSYNHLDTDDKYFMMLNRHYSAPDYDEFTINFENLNFGPSFSNVSLTNYAVILDHINIIPDQNHNASVDVTIEPGHAKLFKVGPTLLQGGTLVVDETISQDVIVKNDINVEEDVKVNIVSYKLTIDNCTFNIDDGDLLPLITSEIDLVNNGKLKFDLWSRSLLACQSNNHPKLVWGMYPGEGENPIAYEVHKKSGVSFYKVATVSASTFEYIDNSEIIYTGTGEENGSTKQYKIVAIFNENPSQTSNIVSVNVNRDSIEKSSEDASDNQQPQSFFLSNNFPNPFNSQTNIKFGIAADTFVNIEIFNILGDKVMTIESVMLQMKMEFPK